MNTDSSASMKSDYTFDLLYLITKILILGHRFELRDRRCCNSEKRNFRRRALHPTLLPDQRRPDRVTLIFSCLELRVASPKHAVRRTHQTCVFDVKMHLPSDFPGPCGSFMALT